MDEPQQKLAFGPGMTMPVIAGEEYTLKDTNGDSLVIEGRDDPRVIEFIAAYDEWVLLLRTGVVDDPMTLPVRLAATFEALPNRIKDMLPSRRIGIVVPGRSL